MRDFSRQPTQAERWLGIILAAALSMLSGASVALLLLRSMWIPAVVCGAFFVAAAIMLCRIAFSAPRALGRKATQVLAWVLLLCGGAGFVLVLLVPASATHRFMVMGGSITFFSAGLAGVLRRNHEA